MSVICGTRMIQAQVAGNRLARVEQRQPPGGSSVAAAHSHTSTSLCKLGAVGSQQRRPNARWAAVGEASEASRGAGVAVAHAHARRHGAAALQGLLCQVRSSQFASQNVQFRDFVGELYNCNDPQSSSEFRQTSKRSFNRERRQLSRVPIAVRAPLTTDGDDERPLVH